MIPPVRVIRDVRIDFRSFRGPDSMSPISLQRAPLLVGAIAIASASLLGYGCASLPTPDTATVAAAAAAATAATTAAGANVAPSAGAVPTPALAPGAARPPSNS